MDTREKTALCALNMVLGFEPKTAHALIGHFGSAAAVFEASRREREEACPYNSKVKLLNGEDLSRAEDELSGLETGGGDSCAFVPYGDESYPSALAECPDAPIGLYLRGNRPLSEVFDARPYIAVVGTRDISPYGREWCREIVSALSRAPHSPHVVSGLAYGTDIIAHATALECGLPTIAVMATGIDKVYPYAHRGWAGRIADAPGSCLLSDYPIGTVSLRINFLRRNRIIAGLCSATILVESKSRGGGLLTARLAFDYDREVFALPGRVDDICSQGCNRLIREQVAHPVESLDSLLEALGLGALKSAGTVGVRAACPGVPKSEAEAVLSSVRERCGATADEISAMTGIPIKTIAAVATMLEADGLLSSDLLGRYCIRR